MITKSFQVLDFNSEAAKEFAQIRSGLEKQGTVCGPYDMQIAAIAKVNHCTVVTRNLSEFTRVPDLSVMGY